jgi:DNA-binding CsgD family transcriptional regulator
LPLFHRGPRERGILPKDAVPAAPEASRQWLRHLTSVHALTAAEAAMLRNVAEGLSPRQAADRLHISCATVRTHLLALYQKTGCKRRAALVRLAV